MGKPLFVLDSSAIIGHLNRELDVDACIGPDAVRCASVVGFMETLAKPGITAAREAEVRRFLSGGEVIDLTPAIRDEAMKNPGASSWVSSLDRKFIVLAWSIPRYANRFTSLLRVVNFPEQAPGYGPRLPIKIRRSCKLKLPDAIIAATAVILNAVLLSNDDHFHTLVWPGLSVRRANTMGSEQGPLSAIKPQSSAPHY